MFRSTTVIREPSIEPSKVIFMLKFGKNYVVIYILCGGVAVCTEL